MDTMTAKAIFGISQKKTINPIMSETTYPAISKDFKSSHEPISPPLRKFHINIMLFV